MAWWHAVVFGVVEGLTEFLPVSSTGHLILTSRLLGLAQTEFLKSFEICIQLGAILAVAIAYGRKVFSDLATMARVLAALFPTLAVGFLLYKGVRALLSNQSVILWSLFIGGVVLVLFDLFHKEKPDAVEGTENIPFAKCVWIGIAQSLAMVPGVSRAGATILGGLTLGLNRKTIVEFSFLLGAPTILAATALDLLKNGSSFDASQWQLLLLGGVVSCAVALGVIRFFIGYVQKHGFAMFGVYRMVLAAVLWMVLK